MQPHHRSCDGTLVWSIEQGRYRDTDLAGGVFVIALSFSGPINRSPMNIYSYIDAATSPAQRAALRGIVETLFAPFQATLVTSEYVPIRVTHATDQRSAEIPSVLHLVTKPLQSPINPGAPVELHNVAGPSAPTVRLAIGAVHTYRNRQQPKIAWEYTGRNAYWGQFAYHAGLFKGPGKQPLYMDAPDLAPHHHMSDAGGARDANG